MKSFARTFFCALGYALVAFEAHAAPAAAPTAAGTPVAAPATEAPPATPHASPPFMAVVNGKVISSAEFETAANEAARQKFYHGKPPEGAVDELLREVSGRMIDRILLLEEARRIGLKPDAKAVDDKLAGYEARYASSSRWQQEREKILPPLRQRLEEDDMLAALEARTRKVPAPTEDKVLAFYKKHPEKFTEPEKMRVSMLLLTVDPSSPVSAWDAAETRAGALRMQLTEAGADFAELARQHSEHDSAAQGGDLGYLHRGMLPDGIQEKIDSMKPGELSPVTRVLQGYALFRYEARQEPRHHEFVTVKPRAADLLERELAENAWLNLTERLRKNAKLEVNTQRYPALVKKATSGK